MAQVPLVQHFDLIARAPGGVARLRELILTLAVQGKLVPQDPSDEPASELLKKIRAEKDRLIAEGKIKQDKPLAEIADDEKPFELPQGWEWVRLGDVQSFTNGFAFKSTSFADEGVGVVRIGNVHHGEITEKGMVYVPFELSEKVDPQFFIAPDDLVITMTGDVKLGFNKSSNRYLLNQRVGKITPILVDPCYLVYCLELVAEKKIEEASGSVIPNVSTGEINATPFALPPLAEQFRIVARVDELMQLCDALEANGQLEAKQHTQLVNTLLGTLTQSDTPEELADNWQRIATHFDVLLDRPDAVDALEQTILQLAVRGLLVPQDPKDEPGSVLLQKIRTEKDRRIAQGKIKSDIPLPLITDEEKLFEVPAGWEWVRLHDLMPELQNGASSRGDSGGQLITVLRLADIKERRISLKDTRQIPITTSDIYKYRLEAGDILITRVNGSAELIGQFNLCDRLVNAIYCDHFIRMRIDRNWITPEFCALLGESPIVRESIQSLFITTAGQKTVNQGHIGSLRLPLPPLAEQSRIVTQVNELRSICSNLRNRLQKIQSINSSLAEELIAQV